MKLKEKIKAIKLREKGYSMKEIAKLLDVSKSTVSLWSKDVRLNEKAKIRLLSRIKLGQYNSAEYKKAQMREQGKQLTADARLALVNLKMSKEAKRLMCAMLYWCEGAKDGGGVFFTNSDPYLVRLFMKLLIDGFGVQKNKFVALLHLHEYHNAKKQQVWWSKILSLKNSQFRKPYLKPHTAKRYRENYPGCISLRYYDSILARKLMYLAQAFTGSVVQW